QRRLGKVGPRSYPLGLGCMGMSDFYGPADRAESLATIHAALDAGINVLDTGDFYGMGHNELLIAEALRGVARDRVVLSVKFGAQRDPAGRWLGYDASPVAVKTALAYTLKRLHTDYIDIYRPARLDPKVPIEDTVGAIADMVAAGYVRAIGLSEVGRETIRRAAQVHPICDLQMEYSLLSRGVERSLLGTCRELGIGLTAYAVLSRGLISDRWDAAKLAVQDFRSHAPRFQGPNEQRNREILEPLRGLARSRGVTMAQMAIAWVLARGDDIVPLIGARTRETLRESLGALAVTLSPAELAVLDQAFPEGVAAGARYGEPQMAHLDSERP
ncbi:aldo/keto reductase, partial [Acidiferrobacter sp.]